jgi:hypothetical protein
LGCSKIQVYTIRYESRGKKQEKCGTCSDGERNIMEKEKRLKVYQLLLILNWKAIEDQTYFREYLRDYMKNGLMKTRSPTDLIMTSTKMD